jgi:DNA-binding response OmpR family regulator
MSAKLVLIADDEKEIREIVSIYLKMWGFESIQARNGQEALDLARAEKPDVILLDIMMPYKDGFEVALELTEDLATALLPIIFFTARADFTSQEYGLSIGAIDYVTKPFNPDDLLIALNKAFEREKTLNLHDLQSARLQIIQELRKS